MKIKWTVEDGARLRAWRKERGLPQREVAARVGVSRMAVSQWERGLTRPWARTTREALRRIGAPLDEVHSWPRSASARLGVWLSEMGWTQADLARALGCDAALVGRWVRGEAPPSPNMRNVLDAIGVPVAVLVSGGDADALIKRARKIGPLPADRTPASKRAALRELATDAVATGDAGVVAAVAEALGIHAGRLRAAVRADVRARHGVSMGVLIDEARQIREAHDASERRYSLKITDELLDVARAAVAHDDPACLRKVAAALDVAPGRLKQYAKMETI